MTNPSIMNVRLIVIYLGDDLPKYVSENLLWIKNAFRENELSFIGNNDEILDRVSALGIGVWKTVMSLEQLKTSLDSTRYKPEFRKGFWVSTLSRFLILEEFMRENKGGPLIQIEADVLLFKNFPFDKFSILDENIAFPLTQDGIGVPSTLYIKNQNAAKELADFTLDCLHKRNIFTDVEILGLLAAEHPLSVCVLPSAFLDSDGFNRSASRELRKLMTKDIRKFGGIFDGSTWGQYITGDDAANNFGVSFLRRNQLHQAVNPSSAEFSYGADGFLTGSINSENLLIYSLHVHSKNWRIFRKQRIGNGPNEELLKLLKINFRIYPSVWLRADVQKMLLVKTVKKLRSFIGSDK